MSDQSKIQHEDLSDPKTLLEYFRLFFSGFAMGSADIVPGVSGGTMAFILGVYETLINAIKSVDVDVIRMGLRFDIKGVLAHIPIRFLITLGMGIIIAVLLLANLLHNLLDDQPTFLFAFFGGLIIASIVAIGIKVRWIPAAIVAFVIATVIAFFIVGLNADDVDPVDNYVLALETETNIETSRNALLEALDEREAETPASLVDELTVAIQTETGIDEAEDALTEALYEPSSPLVLFFSGMIAICAMLLPGISGSFILLILGQYEVVLGAVRTLDIVSVGAVGIGAIIGIIAFSRVISWLLKNYENVTVAALVGFMLGSLRLIYAEAADGVRIVSDTSTLATGQIAVVIGLVAFGFLIVSLLDHMQSFANPVFAWFWKPAPEVDIIAERAEALED